MIEFSLVLIGESLGKCKGTRTSVDKKINEERNRHSALCQDLKKAMDDANADIKIAESERRLANETIEKNKKLADESRRKIVDLQNSIASKEEKIKGINASISKLQAQSSALVSSSDQNAEAKRPDNSAQIANLKSQREHLESSIASDKESIDHSNRIIASATEANNKLDQIKNHISACIVHLEKYKEQCRKAYDAISYWFPALDFQAKNTEKRLNYICGKIESAQESASRAVKAINNLYQMSGYQTLYSSSSVCVQSLEEVKKTADVLSFACSSLNAEEGRLYDVSYKYGQNIKDNVSREVRKCISDIDNSLRNIYSILNDKSDLTKEFVTYLSGYEAIIFDI